MPPDLRLLDLVNDQWSQNPFVLVPFSRLAVRLTRRSVDLVPGRVGPVIVDPDQQ